MSIKYAPLLFVFLLASCETFESFLPPPVPIVPGDKVKTEAEAVRLGMTNCGFEADDPDHWHAALEGGIWNVWWGNGLDTITAEIRKSDGMFDACDVNDERKSPD